MRGMRCAVLLQTLSFALLMSGCGHSTRLYDWGQYEASLERMYAEDGTFVLEQEIAILSEEVERAIDGNRRIPPGKLAHLGYLYFLQGDIPLARASFIREKTLFPESAALMDRLISKLN